MISIQKFDKNQNFINGKQEEVNEFLFKSLQEYGDPKSDINDAINYSLGMENSPGGFVLVANDGEKVVGSVVVNRTGMKKYIPENILVYIATDPKYRGKGIGKKLMEQAIATAEGSIALHVEPNNPAKGLYEKLGFTNKYLEMRYIKK
ncbi:GNAT family N-acetyltransferase [Flavobacterium antarcticum]|uniref:GNAT family N-acetyltransferase n=1 Tax=Flavobacterium antarcticum TaxID=271155 RepID=UPI0003B430DF|nr:GNAT family N-acetyltransferase [Flavobacterium antarcticum]